MTVSGALERLKAGSSGDVRASESMSRHTTYRIGGPAAVYAVMETMHDLTTAVRILEEEQVPWTMVGKGSNLLVADRGYAGAVLVLGREFKRHTVEGEVLKAGAGTVLAHIVQEAFNLGLTGLEWAVGIPGTLGGALAMNAGTHDGSIGDIVDTVTVHVPGEGLRLLYGRDLDWEYRRNCLPRGSIALEASLRVRAGDRLRIRGEMERNLKSRKTTQPIGMPSAGSVFANPPGLSAGRLIEEAGLKGARHGGARISTVHANFIVNEGGATASDVVELVRLAMATVKEGEGVDLRPEIRFLGSFEEA